MPQLSPLLLLVQHIVDGHVASSSSSSLPHRRVPRPPLLLVVVKQHIVEHITNSPSFLSDG
jgi:hypothetical protein